MSSLKDLPMRAVSPLVGNVVAQALLQKNVVISQRLMGIGAGAGVHLSGEKAIFRVLAKRCKPPLRVFDVGANQGQFLDLALANLCTDDFSIDCFEPGDQTYQILNRRAPDRRVTLNNFGIGKEAGNLTLYYDEPGSGLASLTKRKLEHRGIHFDRSESIQIKTIDDYCRQNKIDHIHLLKVDIEGHELDAFAGAKRMFSQNAIDLVTFEFGGCNIDTRSSFREFWFFFLDHKMALYRITPSGYLAKIRKYKEVHEQYRTTNFLAIKED